MRLSGLIVAGVAESLPAKLYNAEKVQKIVNDSSIVDDRDVRHFLKPARFAKVTCQAVQATTSHDHPYL